METTETTDAEGKYIYCIIHTSEHKKFGEHGIGGLGNELYTICCGNIAAVVSNSPVIKYPVSKVNMLSHARAIEMVMREFTVLPVRFSTIAEDEEKVKKILAKENDRFENLISKLDHKKEFGLKVIFIAEEIYKDILDKYQNIKVLKEKLEHSKTYNKLLEAGELVEKALDDERELYKNEILNTLSELAEEVNQNKVYGELMVLNAAFLVEKNKEAEFDRTVHNLDAKYGSKMKFKYVGTVPPFNFVNLVIETGKY